MNAKGLQESWKEQGEDAFAAVAQWRVAHPKATLAEIEQAVDEQITRRETTLSPGASILYIVSELDYKA